MDDLLLIIVFDVTCWFCESHSVSELSPKSESDEPPACASRSSSPSSVIKCCVLLMLRTGQWYTFYIQFIRLLWNTNKCMKNCVHFVSFRRIIIMKAVIKHHPHAVMKVVPIDYFWANDQRFSGWILTDVYCRYILPCIVVDL